MCKWRRRAPDLIAQTQAATELEKGRKGLREKGRKWEGGHVPCVPILLKDRLSYVIIRMWMVCRACPLASAILQETTSFYLQRILSCIATQFYPVERSCLFLHTSSSNIISPPRRHSPHCYQRELGAPSLAASRLSKEGCDGFCEAGCPVWFRRPRDFIRGLLLGGGGGTHHRMGTTSIRDG